MSTSNTDATMMESASTDNGRKRKGADNNKEFVVRLYHMVDDCARSSPHIANWNTGAAEGGFVIFEPDQFKEKYFAKYEFWNKSMNSTTTFPSFHRQLNVYGFSVDGKKVQHKQGLFHQGRLDLLQHIKKQNGRQLQAVPPPPPPLPPTSQSLRQVPASTSSSAVGVLENADPSQVGVELKRLTAETSELRQVVWQQTNRILTKMDGFGAAAASSSSSSQTPSSSSTTPSPPPHLRLQQQSQNLHTQGSRQQLQRQPQQQTVMANTSFAAPMSGLMSAATNSAANVAPPTPATVGLQNEGSGRHLAALMEAATATMLLSRQSSSSTTLTTKQQAAAAAAAAGLDVLHATDGAQPTRSSGSDLLEPEEMAKMFQLLSDEDGAHESEDEEGGVGGNGGSNRSVRSHGIASLRSLQSAGASLPPPPPQHPGQQQQYAGNKRLRTMGMFPSMQFPFTARGSNANAPRSGTKEDVRFLVTPVNNEDVKWQSTTTPGTNVGKVVWEGPEVRSNSQRMEESVTDVTDVVGSMPTPHEFSSAPHKFRPWIVLMAFAALILMLLLAVLALEIWNLKERRSMEGLSTMVTTYIYVNGTTETKTTPDAKNSPAFPPANPSLNRTTTVPTSPPTLSLVYVHTPSPSKSLSPVVAPSKLPTMVVELVEGSPSSSTTMELMFAPTGRPTQEPSRGLTRDPTTEPTSALATSEPSPLQRIGLTPPPSREPTQEPTREPTRSPSTEPTRSPTTEPTEPPSSYHPSMPPTLLATRTGNFPLGTTSPTNFPTKLLPPVPSPFFVLSEAEVPSDVPPPIRRPSAAPTATPTASSSSSSPTMKMKTGWSSSPTMKMKTGWSPAPTMKMKAGWDGNKKMKMKSGGTPSPTMKMKAGWDKKKKKKNKTPNPSVSPTLAEAFPPPSTGPTSVLPENQVPEGTVSPTVMQHRRL